MRPRGTNRAEIDNWIVAAHPAGRARCWTSAAARATCWPAWSRRRNVRGTGIEIAEDCVVKAVQRGLSVHHGNVEEGLDHYSDQSFDLVVMSLTIQELSKPIHVLRESFRVGKQIIVVFPNFAHWRTRCATGRLGPRPADPQPALHLARIAQPPRADHRRLGRVLPAAGLAVHEPGLRHQGQGRCTGGRTCGRKWRCTCWRWTRRGATMRTERRQRPEQAKA